MLRWRWLSHREQFRLEIFDRLSRGSRARNTNTHQRRNPYANPMGAFSGF